MLSAFGWVTLLFVRFVTLLLVKSKCHNTTGNRTQVSRLYSVEVGGGMKEWRKSEKFKNYGRNDPPHFKYSNSKSNLQYGLLLFFINGLYFRLSPQVHVNVNGCSLPCLPFRVHFDQILANAGRCFCELMSKLTVNKKYEITNDFLQGIFTWKAFFHHLN